jgi:hypothetical protein
VLFIICSCQSKLGDEVDPNEIQKNFMDWWYQYNEIMLSEIVALDSNSKEISKETF